MTKENFLNVEINNISKVYSGKRNCCRCGCEGEYIATSYHVSEYKTAKYTVDDKLVMEKLSKAKTLIQNGANCEINKNWADIEVSENKTLTFHFTKN